MEISKEDFERAIINAHLAGQRLARVATKQYAMQYYQEITLVSINTNERRHAIKNDDICECGNPNAFGFECCQPCCDEKG